MPYLYGIRSTTPRSSVWFQERPQRHPHRTFHLDAVSQQEHYDHGRHQRGDNRAERDSPRRHGRLDHVAARPTDSIFAPDGHAASGTLGVCVAIHVSPL